MGRARSMWIARRSTRPLLVTWRRLQRLELSAVGDDDGRRSLSRLRAHSLDGLHDVQTLGHLAEHDVLAIQPSGLHGAPAN